MKNFKLICFLLMAGMFLFLGGCKKDEESLSPYKIYDDPFFRKDNVILKQYSTQNRINSSVEVDSLINKIYNYIAVNNLDSVKNKIEENLGYPLWTITEFIHDSEKTMTITPLYHTGFKSISGFILTDSRINGVNLMSSRHTVKDEFLVIQQYFNDKLTGINDGLSLRSNGTFGGDGDQFGDDTYTWECVDIVNIETTNVGNINSNTDSDGNPIDIGNTTYILDPATGEYYWDDGVYVSFGVYDISQEQDCQLILSTSGYNGNPFGTSGESAGNDGDPWWSTQTNTWTKCKAYYQKRMNEVGNAVTEESMREMIYRNCGGCLKAMSVSDEYIKLWQNTSSNKIKCHLCNQTAGEFLTYFSVLEAWDKITFPCDEINKDALLDELLPPCNQLGKPESNLSWTQLAEKLKGKAWFTKDCFPMKVSAEISSAAKLLNLTSKQISSLSPSQLCNTLSIAECLKPTSPGQPSAPNEGDKAALLDFYNNTTLSDPCTGEEIDKDAIFMNLCESGDVSMSGLDVALDGVDKITRHPTFLNCKALNCIYEQLYNSGSKMFCNNIYRFNYSDDIDLTIIVGTTESNAEGAVTMSNNGTGVVMTFANYNCNWNDHIQLAETLLHESVHAKFRFDNASNVTDEAQYKANFLKYVNEKYGIPYTEHQLMIEKYMEKLASELWELNGKKYDPSYYMAYVWDGLKQYWPDKFSSSKVEQWDDKRNIVKANNPFKC